MSSRSRLLPAILVAILFTSAACGGDDDPFAGLDASDSGADDGAVDGADSGGDDGSGAGSSGNASIVRVFGTTGSADVAGFDLWDGGCGVVASTEDPSFEEGDISVPPGWSVVGTGGSIRLAFGGAERSLRVGLSEVAPDTELDDWINLSNGPFEQVGTMSFGAASVPVWSDGATYYARARAATVRDTMVNVDFLVEIAFGEQGQGDATVFPQSDILAVFDSFVLDPCVVDERTSMFSSRDFVVVD